MYLYAECSLSFMASLLASLLLPGSLNAVPVSFLLRLYGDESELQFWTIAAHYLHSLSREKPAKPTDPALQDQLVNPLDICYDILCENNYFQVVQGV